MLTGTPKHLFSVPNTFKMHWNGLGGPRTRLVKNLPPRDRLKATWPNKGQGAKMGQDGVQKGARPLKKMLTGTPKHSFLVPNTFLMTGMGWEAPGTDLWKFYLPETVSSLRDPTRARGPKWVKTGWKMVRFYKKMLPGTPKHSYLFTPSCEPIHFVRISTLLNVNLYTVCVSPHY